MKESDGNRIDQALFGYEDGHRLIASSTELSTREAYELAAASDLAAGVSLPPGTSYLTGHPFRAGSRYALIRTWSAPEKSRPGSVWGHALLIDARFLSTQQNLAGLLSLFNYPTGDFAIYRDPVRLQSGPSRSSRVRGDLLRSMIGAYYRDKPGALPTEEDDEAIEQALMLVWSQQWPRLRQRFSFKTARTPSIARDTRYSVTHGQPSFRLERSAGAWADVATEDALANEVTPLRRFLWRYGRDTQSPRKRFGDLISIYAAVDPVNHRHISVPAAASIFSRFPDPGDAVQLKLDIFGLGRPGQVRCPSMFPHDLGAFLASNPETVELVSDRFGELLRSNAGVSVEPWLELLARLEPTSDPHGNLALAIIETATRETLDSPKIPSEVRRQILLSKPQLASLRDLKTLGIDEAEEVLREGGSSIPLDEIVSESLTARPSDLSLSIAMVDEDMFLRHAVELSAAGRLHGEWYGNLRGKLNEMGVLQALKTLPAEKFEAWLDLYAHPSPNWFPPPSATVADLLRTHLDAGGSTTDAISVFLFLSAQARQDGVAWDVVETLLPDIRAKVLEGSLAPHSLQLLDSSLPEFDGRSWDLNLRVLSKVMELLQREPGAAVHLDPRGELVHEYRRLVDRIEDQRRQERHESWSPFRGWFG